MIVRYDDYINENGYVTISYSPKIHLISSTTKNHDLKGKRQTEREREKKEEEANEGSEKPKIHEDCYSF